MALEGGCKWIQLRMKEAPYEEVEAVALQLKPLCKEKEAILLLDDHAVSYTHLDVYKRQPVTDAEPAEADRVLLPLTALTFFLSLIHILVREEYPSIFLLFNS